MKSSEIIFKIALSIFILVLIISLLFSLPYVNALRGIIDSDIDTSFNQKEVSNEIIRYSNNKQDTLNTLLDEDMINPLLTQEEITHLEDVKVILLRVRMLGVLSFFTSISLYIYVKYKNKNQVPNLLRNIVVLPVYITLFLVAFAIIDFKSLFNLMHNVLFNNGNWLLTEEHILIILYPQSFWVISIMVILVLWLGILFVLQQINKKHLFRKIIE